MNFSEKLKSLRKDKKLDQEQLADKDHLNISISTLRRYEQTGQYPNVDTLRKMKEIFGCSYDYLLDDNCTTTDKNIEIAEYLGITAKTVNGIKQVKNKEFLEDLFINEKCNELLALLKETADLSLIYECGIATCLKLYKSKNYNEPATKMQNSMQMLFDYMKQEKVKQSYWESIMDNNECKGFISSINYILNCWNKHQKINENSEKLKFFNSEVLEQIRNNLKEYQIYCNSNITVVIEKFNTNYINNKKKKLNI